MSILDFTTGLFRDPVTLRSFVDNPDQALRDAGLPDATPEQVHALLPVVAESTAPDHPLQEVVHSADLPTALRALDVEDLVADAHDHHREVQMIEKAVGGPDTISAHAQSADCTPETAVFEHVVEAIANWDPIAEVDKGLGDVPDDQLTPPVEEDSAEPADDYPDRGEDHSVPADDHAGVEHLIDDDHGPMAWGKAID
jgi:hypothetical protein